MYMWILNIKYGIIWGQGGLEQEVQVYRGKKMGLRGRQLRKTARIEKYLRCGMEI